MRTRHGFWLITVNARAIGFILVLLGFIIDRYTHHAIWRWLQYWAP